MRPCMGSILKRGSLCLRRLVEPRTARSNIRSCIWSNFNKRGSLWLRRLDEARTVRCLLRWVSLFAAILLVACSLSLAVTLRPTCRLHTAHVTSRAQLWLDNSMTNSLVIHNHEPSSVRLAGQSFMKMRKSDVLNKFEHAGDSSLIGQSNINPVQLEAGFRLPSKGGDAQPSLDLAQDGYTDKGVGLDPEQHGISAWSNYPSPPVLSPLVTSPDEKPTEPVLAVLVVSRPSSVLLRQAIRRTWARDCRDLGVSLWFLVGQQEAWDEIVAREAAMHQDLLSWPEQESYQLLPLKVLAGLTLLLQQEPAPRYLLKIDDDTVVNLPFLLQQLHAGILASHQILGAIYLNASVMREADHKWAVSWLDYPFPTYPPYAAGGGYLLTRSGVSRLLQARDETTDWVHLEDVYVTGLLASKANLSHLHHPAFSYWLTPKASACDLVLDRRITSLHHTEKEVYRLYSDIQDLLRTRNTTKCRP